MKKFLKALPLPACGVMLGLAALGNLLQAVFTNIFGSAGTGDTLRYICGALSSIIWFAFISLLCLLVLVTMRYVKIPVKEPAQPLFCIYTAPTALCIAGYIQSVTNKSAAMVAGMLALSSLLYVIVLIKTPSLLKLKFYPSYAAFTFPFAITAIAAMQSMAFFKNAGWPQPWLRYVVIVETVIAVVMNLYAFIKYVQAIPALMKQD